MEDMNWFKHKLEDSIKMFTFLGTGASDGLLWAI
jgi:hypothetical protein